MSIQTPLGTMAAKQTRVQGRYGGLQVGSVTGKANIIAAVHRANVYYREELIRQTVEFMMVVIPERTGALLASYINSLLLNDDLISFLEYAERVEGLDFANWTKSSTVPHAKKITMDKMAQIAPQIRYFALMREGLV